MLKATPPQDALAPASPLHRSMLQVFAVLPFAITQATNVRTFSRVQEASDVIRFLFLEHPALGRAPPAGITLLSA